MSLPSATSTGLLCLLVVLLGLAGPGLACIVKPGGCIHNSCELLPDIYPNPSNSFSLPSTWSSNSLRYVAFWNGVYNKLAPTPTAPKSDSYSAWLKTASSQYLVNIEKYPVESTFLLASYPRSLKSCCNDCKAATGCVLYLYRPNAYTKNYALNAANSGTCYLLKGGSHSGDGPYDPWSPAHHEYGTPYAGTNSQQAKSNTPQGYLGGFCNPGNSTTNVVDDPHFTGAHGTHFDFNGQLNKAYCLVTDKSLHINAVLKGYKNTNTFHATVGEDGKAIRSWIRELGLVWTDGQGMQHSARLVARSGKAQERGDGFLQSLEVDGQQVQVPSTPGSSFQAGDLTLSLLAVAQKGWYEVEKFSLKIGSQLDLAFDMRVAHPKLQAPDDAEVHFNLVFNNIQVTDRVHGVLGQTYRNSPEQILKALKFSELGQILGAPVQADGTSGKGFLEGSVSDYVASGVTKADCKVSTFSA